MEINASQTLSHPAQLVFETVRDKQPDLVSYMPNIASCEVLEREEGSPEVRLVNRWQATLDDLPRLLRPVVSPDLVSWLDRARWNDTTRSCTWELESLKAKEIFACRGTTTISESGPSSCTFTVSGDLNIYTDKVPGVPRLLARKIREPLERFIAGSIRPNLTGVATAVQQYLDEQA